MEKHTIHHSKLRAKEDHAQTTGQLCMTCRALLPKSNDEGFLQLYLSCSYTMSGDIPIFSAMRYFSIPVGR